jgi:diguanylate cyclase (GGDEF)-like protein/PAS domain S-box-containing protein
VARAATSSLRRFRLAALRNAFQRLGGRNRARARLLRSEDRLNTIVTGARGIIYISELGAEGRWTYVSPQIEEILGFSPGEWVDDADLWARQLHPDDRERVLAEEEDTDSYTPGQVYESEYRLLTRAGESRWLRDAAAIVATEDGTLVWSGVLTDVTERRLIEEALRASEERFRAVIETASDAFVSVDVDGTIIEWNRKAEETFGWVRDEVVGQRLATTIVPESSRQAHEQGFERFVRTGTSSVVGLPLEVNAVRRDGVEFPVELSVWVTVNQGVQRVNAFVRDTSDRKALEAVTHQAFHDPLTDLANRALFTDRVAAALARRGDSATTTVAVLLLDLDDFKTVNDSLGHAAGDEVLREVASRLEATVRPTDTVARFGGDEFSVLLDGVVDTQEAADVAGRVLRSLERHLEIDGKEVFPRASLGICMADREHDIPAAEELLRNADVAMYMAKRDSKGGYRIFEPTMHERVVERLELRAELQRAIDHHQLEVHYQPVVRLSERVVCGVEALLRWQHPERGAILPDQFIPLAEETGLIIPIGRWVLREACRQAARLPEVAPRTPLTMSVNLSVKQLQSDTIVDDVRRALRESDLDPSLLVLEITESVMMADTDLAVQQLHDLKALGVRLAMDDFGTGYSSLSYLSRLPVDILKMDRSFLMSGHETDSSLAAAIISLGKSLKLDVVAEGIERIDQLPSLRELGCELGQGFLFAQPMSKDSLDEFLKVDEQPLEGEQRESHAA